MASCASVCHLDFIHVFRNFYILAISFLFCVIRWHSYYLCYSLVSQLLSFFWLEMMRVWLFVSFEALFSSLCVSCHLLYVDTIVLGDFLLVKCITCLLYYIILLGGKVYVLCMLSRKVLCLFYFMLYVLFVSFCISTCSCSAFFSL